MLASKQIFQKLRIVRAQVKTCRTSKNLLNGICQDICSLYQAK